MKHSLFSRVVFAFLFIVTLSGVAAARKIPLRDFFKNPERTAYQLSPDGSYYAFLAPYEKRLNIFVQARSGGEPVRLTNETARDIAGYWWKGNDRILFMHDNNGDENYHLYAVSRDGKTKNDLTPFDSTTIQVVDGLIDNDNEILIATNQRDHEIFDVYHLDLTTNKLRLIAQNPGNINGWVTDHDGKLRVASTTDGVNSSLLYRESEQDTFRVILTTDFKENLSPLFFTFDNKNLYASSNIGRDKSAIVVIDPSTGKELSVLYQNPEVDVSNLIYSHKRKVLTFARYETDKEHNYYLDPQAEALHKKLEAKLPGYQVNITSLDRNEDLFIIRNYNDRSVGSIYLYDLNVDKLTKVSDVCPWLHENELAEMKPISFTSRDGMTLHGYLTLPKGSSGTHLPIVVNPHGGPWARDSWGYNPEVQLFANRGYGVLQVNFRGSTSYGKKFWESSFHEWGKNMQDDISDGVQWLVQQGIADPKRVAIYGGSYGGYATLAGVAFTPDLYCCAIDYCGVANLFTFMKTIPPYWKPYLDMFHEMVGDPQKDSVMLASASPVFHADRIKVPMLVLQGKNDPRVNINESDQMVNALKARGIDVTYIVKNNEGHGFHDEENRFDAYEAMESFLEKHLAAD
ncbi:MAG TPA: S9 family peptidase [Candidatus Kapabacteria bacterium]|jgi:dipeptidyl aminopeptidase/acylaminoacyl peptidase|nr:S9 family peptidase [Candidatus Kapabacteria bacterium]